MRVPFHVDEDVILKNYQKEELISSHVIIL